MKKLFRFSVLFFLMLLVCVVWVESTLSLQDSECRCRNPEDMLSRCVEMCALRNSTCDGFISYPMGDCVDLTCWTYFDYLCADNFTSVYLSRYDFCSECYPEP